MLEGLEVTTLHLLIDRVLGSSSRKLVVKKLSRMMQQEEPITYPMKCP
jgi:hypothetical protein